MYRISAQLVLLIIFAVFAWGLYSFAPSLFANNEHFSQTTHAEEKVWPVRVIAARFGSYHIDQQVFGEVKATRVSTPGFQLSGCIAELDDGVNVGTSVVAGQVLASLDLRPLELNLKSAQATVAELQSQLAENQNKVENLEKLRVNRMLTMELSNKSHARQTRLVKKKIVPMAIIEQAQITANEARLSLLTVESEISAANITMQTHRKRILKAQRAEDRASLNLQYAVLKAPHTGVVASKSYDNGTCVSAMQPVLRLVDTSTLEVQLDLPLHMHRALLAQGPMQKWRVVLLVAGNEIDLKVIRQAPELSTKQQMVRVITVPRNSETQSSLVVGQKLRAVVTVQKIDNVLKLPFSALFNDASLYSISDGRLVRHNADILYRDNLTVYARADVPPGTAVVTTRLKTAVPGLKVKILSK